MILDTPYLIGYIIFFFSLVDKITSAPVYYNPQTVALRLLCYSISELRVLRGSWDSVKQYASALASAWHKEANFKSKTRMSAIRVFNKDMINTPEQAFQISVFLKTMDTALMQLNKRISGQQSVT